MAAKVRHDGRRPFDRVLAFLDVLLARAALVVEGDDTLDRPRQVGDDKADARVQLAWMPLDLGHDAARLVPALRPIGEAGVVAGAPRAAGGRPGASADSRSGTARRCWLAAGSRSRYAWLRETRTSRGWRRLHHPGNRGASLCPGSWRFTGSSTARQPAALCTSPGLSAQRSTSPNWLNTNSG